VHIVLSQYSVLMAVAVVEEEFREVSSRRWMYAASYRTWEADGMGGLRQREQTAEAGVW
jgi:hypothetical protein